MLDSTHRAGAFLDRPEGHVKASCLFKLSNSLHARFKCKFFEDAEVQYVAMHGWVWFGLVCMVDLYIWEVVIKRYDKLGCCSIGSMADSGFTFLLLFKLLYKLSLLYVLRLAILLVIRGNSSIYGRM